MPTDSSDSARARVFISCGQAKDSDEVEIAAEIGHRIEELGFEYYIAVQEQSLRGLKENIFGRLENSEYFIFVDFKREQLVGGVGDPPVCRGSLFSHQELAIASYLDITPLVFQESGVKLRDGILPFVQANANQFTDRRRLPSIIADEVQRRRWDPNWRNELVLGRPDPTQHGDAQMLVMGRQKTGRFFHIEVYNRHPRKMARNCYVYLERATRLDPPSSINVKAVEIKWEGYTLPNAHIPPLIVRRFDGFYILHDDPTRLCFQLFTDSTAFIPDVHGVGKYELHYSVVADDFPTARGSFLLNLNHSLSATTLEPTTRQATEASS
jgi:hypothetical protein